jgi:hypothetical protein
MSIHEATFRLRGQEPQQRKPLTVQDCEQIAAVARPATSDTRLRSYSSLPKSLPPDCEKRGATETRSPASEPGDEAVRPDIEVKVALGRLGFGALIAEEHRA